ncbi:hypothetical protein TUM4438_33710 [Shewanella sairae]|uniref:Esterase n=1 Tax=Shewanella sairae TaxID=190310 RepID=A0ABQ4PMT7_9GAMM|nr:hypothetical protein TUM4438_33710 [Shewanella sairae]
MRGFILSLLLFSPLLLADDLVLAKQAKLKSAVLAEDRNMLIKLPEHYHDSEGTYPVLYLLHAQWDMLSALSVIDLLAEQVPNFIVVGIESRGK